MFCLFNRYLSTSLIFIWLSEMVLIPVITIVITSFRFEFHTYAITAYDPYFLKSLFVAVVYISLFHAFGLYSPELYSPGRQMSIKLMQATLVSTIVLFCVYYIVPSLRVWRGILLANALLLPTALFCWRYVFAKLLHVSFPSKRVLIIGSGSLAKDIGTDIYYKNAHGFELVGFIDDNPAQYGKSIVNPGVIGGYGDIERLVEELRIDRIIVALKDRRSKLPMAALLNCKLNGVTVEEGETFHERASGRVPVDQLKPSWLIFSDGFKSLRSRKLMKRVFDIVLSSIGLVFAFPIMVITAIAIKIESPGPVIFKQVRVGERGRYFTIYKFRSMRQDAESKSGPVWAMTKDDRVTRIGAFIRKTRIDELPQLVNVLMGDMSFVGPRPERPYFVDMLKKAIPYYDIRTVVKPGITGWAQIKYSYGASVKDAMKKLQYDLFYIKNMTPILDTLIILLTLKVIFTGRGAR